MENPTTPQEMAPPSDMYRTSRGQIEHFDNAINVRVIWLSIGQSFFFGVYATLVSIKAPTPDLLDKQKILTIILPIAALLTALFTLFDVIANLVYMRRLRLTYEENTKDIESDRIYPYIWGKPTDRVFQHSSPTLIPIIFIISWVVILLYTYNVIK
jgi:hypothetical protein